MSARVPSLRFDCEMAALDLTDAPTRRVDDRSTARPALVLVANMPSYIVRSDFQLRNVEFLRCDYMGAHASAGRLYTGAALLAAALARAAFARLAFASSAVGDSVAGGSVR